MNEAYGTPEVFVYREPRKHCNIGSPYHDPAAATTCAGDPEGVASFSSLDSLNCLAMLRAVSNA